MDEFDIDFIARCSVDRRSFLAASLMPGRVAATVIPLVAGLLTGAVHASASPLTLTGDYLQVGISDYGTFGSGGSTEPGLLHDPSGTRTFYPDGIANDYLTPGDPHDGFAINSTQTGLVINDNHGAGETNSFGTASPTLLTGAAAKGYDQAAAWTVTYGNYLTVDNRYFFRTGDERVLVQTTITARTLLTNLSFGRSVDPDPDVARFNSYDTVNTRGDTSTAPQDLVSAAGSQTGLTLGILNGSGTTFVHNTEITDNCCSNDDPNNVLANTSTLGYPDTVSGDFGLQMAWSLGSLTPGQSLTILYSYVFGTNQASVSVPNATIDTTGGDLAPNVFSLGSPAAQASTVVFEGGTLRMIGGSFAGNIVPSPVTIDVAGGTVDTSTGNGGFSGIVSGPGSFTLIGGGQFSLLNENTFAGGTTVFGSTLTIGRASSLGSGPAVLTGGGVLQIATGAQVTLDNPVVVNGSGALDSNGGALVLTKALAGSGLLVFGNTGGTYASDERRFGNSIVLNATSEASGGSVLLDQSFVSLRADNALATGSLSVLQGGQLDLGGNNQTVATLSGQGVITNTGVSSRAASGGVSRLTVAAGTFGGVIEDGHYTGFVGADGVSRDTQGLVQLVKGSDGSPSGGTLSLTGANSYSGGTMLDAGTLALGSNGALGRGTLVMAPGTTLAFVADALRIANPIRFAESGDPTFDTGANSVTLFGPITGPGDVSKIGTGTLDLAGANTYTGGTFVREGTLLVDGSTVSTASVFSGARIGGSGTIGGLNVLGGGTLAPGSGVPFSTLRVSGDTNFAPGSTFAVNINPAGQSDAITAGGAATLDGGTVTVIPASGVYSVANRYTILSAAGGRTGQFSALSAPDFAFLTPALSYDATHVYLGFAQNAPFGSAAGTPNQRATAGAVESLGPGNPLYDAVLVQEAAGARQAFQSTSGEAHASVPAIAMASTHFISEAVIGRLWNVPVLGGGDAISVLDQFGTVTTNPLLRCYSPDETAGGVVPSNYTVWGQAVGDFGRNGGDGNAQTVDRTLAGFALGIDTRVDAPLLENWRLGLAGGYTSDAFFVSNGGGHGTFENVFGTLYGGARYGAVDIRLGASYGGTSTDTRRTVAFPGFNEAERARYGGDTALGFGEIGYRFAFPRSVIEPVIDGSVTNVHQDRYQERGGAAALVGASEDTLVGTTTLGFRGEITPFDGVRFVSRVFLGWQHSYGDVNPAATLAFASGSAAFNVYGTPLDRNAAVAETDFVWRTTDALSLSLAYTGQIGPRDHDNAVRGRAEYRF